MDKYIGFDTDSKKTVACVMQKGKRDRYAIFNITGLTTIAQHAQALAEKETLQNVWHSSWDKSIMNLTASIVE